MYGLSGIGGQMDCVFLIKGFGERLEGPGPEGTYEKQEEARSGTGPTAFPDLAS